MKKLPLIFLIVILILIVAACAPNRLKRSLEARDTSSATAIPAPIPDGRNLQPQLGNANINLGEVVTLLPPDAIPAIWPDEAPNIMVTAAEAEAAGMRPNVRVLGVSVEGDSRAYPIPFMSQHEIVNDNIGGKLLAVTW